LVPDRLGVGGLGGGFERLGPPLVVREFDQAPVVRVPEGVEDAVEFCRPLAADAVGDAERERALDRPPRG